LADKILIIDDDMNGLQLLSLTLRVEGFQVIAANSGQQGLGCIRDQEPDLVILDVMMPGMDGLEVCRRIRQSPSFADIPVIMLTARTEVNDRVTGLRLGADDYIPKPASPAEVVARVRAVLARVRRTAVRKGKIISFVGAKGGVGTSTVAANSAVALSQSGKGAMLIDFRSYLGTVSLQLGLDPRASLATLLELDSDKVDDRQLDSCLTSYRTGLQVLASPQIPSRYHDISPAHAQRILDSARSLTEYVILDLPAHPSPGRKVALEQSDMTVLVLEPEPAALVCAQVALAHLKELPIRTELVGTLIVNRSGTAVPLSLTEIRSSLPVDLLGIIPHTPDAFTYALKQRTPLVFSHPENLAAAALGELAQRLSRERVVAARL
jgi:DNA-binding response OmpR family regulator